MKKKAIQSFQKLELKKITIQSLSPAISSYLKGGDTVATIYGGTKTEAPVGTVANCPAKTEEKICTKQPPTPTSRVPLDCTIIIK